MFDNSFLPILLTKLIIRLFAIFDYSIHLIYLIHKSDTKGGEFVVVNVLHVIVLLL